MRLSTILLLPLALAAADSQAPLKEKAAGWFDKAKAYIPSGTPPDPIDAGAAKVAERVVERVNVRNYQRKLSPKIDTEEEWILYMTGGNKSCYGRCGPVNLVWNESVPLLASLPRPSGSAELHLGSVDCEKEEVLCTGWAVTLPSIYHFKVPRKSDPQAKTELHIVPLNLTTTQVSHVVDIPTFSKSRYLEFPEYTGVLHPIDGLAAKLGLLTPFGYLMWGLGVMPSWVMMVGISFVSRQIMSRRMGQNAGVPVGVNAPQPQAGTPQQARPAPAAAPRSGGGKKKR